MDFSQLIKKMNIYSISAIYGYDLAVSAKKLMQWDEKLWNIKPRLSTGADRPELSKKELPLCLEMSDEMQLAIYLNREDDVKSDKKYLFNANDLVPTSKLVATQVILFNFTLLEEYEFYRYNLLLREKIADLSNDKFTIKDFMNRGLNTLTNGVLVLMSVKDPQIG